jgi:hypothetical protein
MLLRYQVSEANRRLFHDWETLQLVGGAIFFLYLLFWTREGKFSLAAVLAMVAIVVLQRFLLTPELISYGRNIDFLPPDAISAARDRFWLIHSGYAAMEALKWGIVLVLVGRTIFWRRHDRSGDVLDEFDLIDKPNHRHINR